jgi:DNA-binding PadR family transcriptional regulator
VSLKYAVLGFLKSAPRHGYEIKQSFERRFGTAWSVSYGQLYPTLKKLAGEGLIEKRTEAGKKTLDRNVYKITENGKKSLEEWMGEIPKKVRFSAKDDFSLHLLLSMDAEDRRVTVKNIEIQRSHYTALLKRLEKRHELLSNSSFQTRCLVRKQMLHVRAEVAWLEEMLDILRT